ncbi:retrovirus-related Pol polyprotein from transposon 412 [Trichonephila clavipes]|nr:retrovirus-related Pol polyprotein from transposon 412 [Trichonephila clavipes]
MDVLLHDAKSTAFMSTLDLKFGLSSGRGQSSGPDKTAFAFALLVHLGTKRMPFDFANAPATFSLMDQFRNGLPNVNILVYLDDIVVLSETF